MEQIFDKTEIYENGIIDIVNKLRAECNRNGIPMFVSLCIKNTPKESVYKNEMVSAASSGINLTDDKFIDFVNVLNGFTTIPKKTELDFSDEVFS